WLDPRRCARSARRTQRGAGPYRRTLDPTQGDDVAGHASNGGFRVRPLDGRRPESRGLLAHSDRSPARARGVVLAALADRRGEPRRVWLREQPLRRPLAGLGSRAAAPARPGGRGTRAARRANEPILTVRGNSPEIRPMLVGGDRRSIAQSNRARSLIERNPSLVSDVAALTDDADWLVAQRALDLLEKLAHEHPQWVEPHKQIFIGPL